MPSRKRKSSRNGPKKLSMYDIQMGSRDNDEYKTLVAGILGFKAANRYYGEYARTSRKTGQDFKLIKVTVTQRTVRTTSPLKKASR